ncbi:hypothetical protein AVEN_142231-1, partial [Araneus ventricosus]
MKETTQKQRSYLDEGKLVYGRVAHIVDLPNRSRERCRKVILDFLHCPTKRKHDVFYLYTRTELPNLRYAYSWEGYAMDQLGVHE